MSKRKSDAINYDLQIASSKRNSLVNISNNNNFQVSNVSNDELYSSNNIQLLLSWHYIKDSVIYVDIINYNDMEIKELCSKQQQKLMKRLKYDLYQFGSTQLTEKFYVLAQKDNKIITASSIIRFFIQNGEILIRITPLIDYDYAFKFFCQLIKIEVFDNIDITILSKKKCGLLMKSEGIEISKFIEVIKVKISDIDNVINIDESIKSILEESSDSYEIAHQEIIDKYETEFPNNNGIVDYSSKEDVVLNVIDEIKDTIENEEIILDVVEQLIAKAVKKSERGEKKLSWDISVIDNEGKTRNNKEVLLNDQEAIEIFARAVKNWDLELFKQAKGKSKDFIKLVDYFDEEVQHEFWCHFYRFCYYKSCFEKEYDFEKKASIKQEYQHFMLKTLNGYEFLIKNLPDILDRFKQKLEIRIRDLPELDGTERELIKLIESKVNQANVNSNNQVTANVQSRIINLASDNLQTNAEIDNILGMSNKENII